MEDKKYCLSTSDVIAELRNMDYKKNIEFEGKVYSITLISLENDGEDEEIRMEIASDPDLQRLLEQSDADIAAGRTYSSAQVRERLLGEA